MLLAGSGLMFAAMVIVGVIVAKFRHDWEHHAVAGEISPFKTDFSFFVLPKCTNNFYDRLGCGWYVPSLSYAFIHSLLSETPS